MDTGNNMALFQNMRRIRVCCFDSIYMKLLETDLNSSVMDVTRACGLTGKWQRQHFGVMTMPSIMPLVVVMWVNKFAKIYQTIYLICVLFAV